MKYLLAAGMVALFFRFSASRRNTTRTKTRKRFVPHIGQVSAIMLTVLWLVAMGFILFVV